MAKRKPKSENVKPYEIKAWSGLPQYCCLLCSFDTLDEDAMFDHIATHVTPPHSAEAAFPKMGTPYLGEEEKTVEKADGVFEIDLKEDQ